MLTFIVPFLLSICLSYILILAFSHIFRKLDILDNPKKYHKKRKAIPYSLGVIFYIIFAFLSIFFVDWSYKLFLILGFGGIITLVSFCDDLFSLSAKTRLILQIIIGAIIGVTSIKIGYVSNIF
jgi:UDP-N-acetylmuramyl pentapeptide phosphotransferase/UDP-N-acetylglucosamine-1-phosphate transferase